jgi:predicted DsbA family dithiol-disulfide isomerase
VQESTREAHAMGINAVPAFVLQEQYLLLGAQPHDVFEQVIAQLRGEAVADGD